MPIREFYTVSGGLPEAIQVADKFTTKEQSEEGYKLYQELLTQIAETPSIHDEIIIKKGE